MSMLSNLKVLKAMFKQEKIHYKHMSLRSYAFEMGGGESSLRCCEVICHISRDLIQFYVCCPVKDSGEHRDKILEYLIRANYDLRVGNFEYDMESGEIRYKATLYTGNETTATVDQAMGVLTHAYGIMDTYSDGLLKLMFDPDATVEECFRQSESGLELDDLLKPDTDEEEENSDDEDAEIVKEGDDGEIECFFGDDHLTATLDELEDQDDELEDDYGFDDDDEEDEDEHRRREQLREKLLKRLSATLDGTEDEEDEADEDDEDEDDEE